MPVQLEVQPQDRLECLRYCSRPNCSLSEASGRKVFWAVAVMTLVPACGFGILGYWLMLPFAGLEIGVLAWAFERMSRRRGDYELLEILGEEVLLDSRQDGKLEHRRFNRRWVQLVVQNKNPMSGHVRLAFRSHGRETEIGLFLNDEDRLDLAGSLRSWVGQAR